AAVGVHGGGGDGELVIRRRLVRDTVIKSDLGAGRRRRPWRSGRHPPPAQKPEGGLDPGRILWSGGRAGRSARWMHDTSLASPQSIPFLTPPPSPKPRKRSPKSTDLFGGVSIKGRPPAPGVPAVFAGTRGAAHRSNPSLPCAGQCRVLDTI